jgi:TPP-dependent pyruvate/acetoin dehydrogenase alpha subunit
MREEDKKSRELFGLMVLIRAFESVILELFTSGKVRGTTHTCIGQEANAVGVISCINKDDFIFSNHRNHGHYLSLTEDVKGLLLEIMGSELGASNGIGGSQHIHNKNFISNGVQGGIASNAVGVALSMKMKKNRGVTICFLGDGTFGEGILYESLNIASLWNIPILFVVENNQYAQSTPVKLNLSGSINKRFEAFNISVEEISSFNIFEIQEKANMLINNVRDKQKPMGLIINTYRFASHSKGDDFRDPAEIEKMKESDPLLIAAKNLKINNVEHLLNDQIEFIRNIASDSKNHQGEL